MPTDSSLPSYLCKQCFRLTLVYFQVSCTGLTLFHNHSGRFIAMCCNEECSLFMVPGEFKILDRLTTGEIELHRLRTEERKYSRW
jgi:hypothetical protein